MSLDFRVTSLPYKSSSFATPEGALFLPLYDEQLKLAQGEEPLKPPPPGWQANVICKEATAT